MPHEGQHRTGPERGFTLVELLVVVLIVGVLVAIAVPQFLRQREASYRTALKADLHNAVLVVETRFGDDPDGFVALTNAYLHSSKGLKWAGSRDVSVSVSNQPSPTKASYCLQAGHGSLPGEVWRYKKGVDAVPRRLACKAAP